MLVLHPLLLPSRGGRKVALRLSVHIDKLTMLILQIKYPSYHLASLGKFPLWCPDGLIPLPLHPHVMWPYSPFGFSPSQALLDSPHLPHNKIIPLQKSNANTKSRHTTAVTSLDIQPWLTGKRQKTSGKLLTACDIIVPSSLSQISRHYLLQK